MQYFTLPLLFQWNLTDFKQTLPFLMDPADSPLDSIGVCQTWLNSTASPSKVQWKSGQATWKQEMVGLARILCPLDIWWTSNRHSGHPMDTGQNKSYCAKSSVHWTSNGLLSKKGCKRVLSVQSIGCLLDSHTFGVQSRTFYNSIARFETCASKNGNHGLQLVWNIAQIGRTATQLIGTGPNQFSCL